MPNSASATYSATDTIVVTAISTVFEDEPYFSAASNPAQAALGYQEQEVVIGYPGKQFVVVTVELDNSAGATDLVITAVALRNATADPIPKRMSSCDNPALPAFVPAGSVAIGELCYTIPDSEVVTDIVFYLDGGTTITIII